MIQGMLIKAFSKRGVNKNAVKGNAFTSLFLCARKRTTNEGSAFLGAAFCVMHKSVFFAAFAIHAKTLASSSASGRIRMCDD